MNLNLTALAAHCTETNQWGAFSALTGLTYGPTRVLIGDLLDARDSGQPDVVVTIDDSTIPASAD